MQTRLWRLAPASLSDYHRFCCRFLALSSRAASPPEGTVSSACREGRSNSVVCRELTALPSHCSRRLIAWPKYKQFALCATFLFQTTLRDFISRIPLRGDFYFKTLKRNFMLLLFLPEGDRGVEVKAEKDHCSRCILCCSIGNCSHKYSQDSTAACFSCLDISMRELWKCGFV